MNRHLPALHYWSWSAHRLFSTISAMVVPCAAMISISARSFSQEIPWIARPNPALVETAVPSERGIKTVSATWVPSWEETSPSISRITTPYQSDAWTDGTPPLLVAARPRDANSADVTGTATLDSLPKFRGIKGIKNLPGGVGTVLMANPHVGESWYPTVGTHQPGTSMGLQKTYFQAGIPVWNEGPETFVLTSHLDSTRINTQAMLPDTKQPFPNQLWSVAFGANYLYQFESGKLAGLVLDVGSASDQPFQSGREILASGTGFLLLPDSDVSAWFVGIHASTNSQVLYGIPIPGGGYFYHPSEDFQAIVGIPFSVISWKPTRDWQLQTVWAFLTTVHTRVVYQPSESWQLYAGFDWINENYRRVDRIDNQDHLFYYEKRLAAGWLWWFAPHVGFEVAGGWAFDRYYSEIHGFKLKGHNTIELNSGPFLSAQFDIRF